MGKTIKLPELAWYDSRELELSIPDNWQVDVCNMAGFDVPAMQPKQIKAAINNTLGSPPIRELAKGKKEVAIIFDDLSRITRVARIVPSVLEELDEAGIPDDRIRFISALGCHGAMGRSDFVRKLGEEVVSRFQVYNHNAFSNYCAYVGTTSHGIKIFANAEVMQCDLKIGIGSISPHMMVGFGGGSKIIFPGITSLETNEALHRLLSRIIRENPDMPMGMGINPNNTLRKEIEEVGKMIGLDIKIDCLFNMWGDTTHIFAGDPRAVFTAGVEEAKKHYLSPRSVEKDIVIANIYLKANEPHAGITNSIPSISSRGGDLVLICNAPEGIVTHFLLGAFGRETGAPLCKKFRLPHRINRMIILNEYPDPTFASSFDPADKVVSANNWGKVLDLLGNKNCIGHDVQVAVYPNADVQYCVPGAI